MYPSASWGHPREDVVRVLRGFLGTFFPLLVE